MMERYRTPLLGTALAAMLAASPADVQADEPAGPITIEAEYVHDVAGIVHGPATGIRRADLLSISADISLEEGIGWQGARLHFNALAGTGERPNDLAGTLQGINNIEVMENRVRLFEAWIEQAIPAINGSLRVGFSDLNSEFYVNDAAGLLLAPAFGIGSELAATGSNGPAIFPSTAATVRLRSEPWREGYVQLAAVNADAGVLGDRQGIRPLFKRGALLIGELGHAGKAKFAFGAWTYTRLQDDIRLTTLAGERQPAGRRVPMFWPRPRWQRGCAALCGPGFPTAIPLLIRADGRRGFLPRPLYPEGRMGNFHWVWRRGSSRQSIAPMPPMPVSRPARRKRPWN